MCIAAIQFRNEHRYLLDGENPTGLAGDRSSATGDDAAVPPSGEPIDLTYDERRRQQRQKLALSGSNAAAAAAATGTATTNGHGHGTSNRMDAARTLEAQEAVRGGLAGNTGAAIGVGMGMASDNNNNGSSGDRDPERSPESSIVIGAEEEDITGPTASPTSPISPISTANIPNDPTTTRRVAQRFVGRTRSASEEEEDAAIATIRM
jgi:hypothetical protein